MLGRISDWSALTTLLPFEWTGGARRRSAVASTLLAALEMARDGKVELQQMARGIGLGVWSAISAFHSLWEKTR